MSKDIWFMGEITQDAVLQGIGVDTQLPKR